MAYDAVAIGEKEVSLGLAEVDSLLAAHGLLALNNNILDATTGEPRYTPYTILKAGELKIGVTSMLGGDAIVARSIKERENVAVSNGVAASREVLETFRKKKVDLKVLLAHTGLQKGEMLADSLAGFDVILIGHGSRSWTEPKQVNGVILASPGSRSNQLGEVTIVVEDRMVQSFEGRSYQLQQDDGPLEPTVKALTWTHLELDENGNRVKAGAKTDSTEATETSLDQSSLDPKLQKNEAAKAEPAMAYLGNENCRLCHADIFESYEKSAHAEAFQVIAEDPKEWQNPACWNCHTLGFGEPTGHSTTELQPDLWNVQCESCHGMGTGHARGELTVAITEATCTKCHTSEWSPDFEFKKSLALISHKSNHAKSN